MTKEYPLFTDAEGNVWTTECPIWQDPDVIDPDFAYPTEEKGV
jgi:hypothetical protein